LGYGDCEFHIRQKPGPISGGAMHPTAEVENKNILIFHSNSYG
jgi:hypothetical protein